jgi:nitrate/nitrite transporter NarK
MSVSTKIVRVFAFSFLGVFLPALANIVLDASNTLDWSVAKAALVALVLASFSAAIRAVVAFLPILPDDNVGVQRKP